MSQPTRSSRTVAIPLKSEKKMFGSRHVALVESQVWKLSRYSASEFHASDAGHGDVVLPAEVGDHHPGRRSRRPRRAGSRHHGAVLEARAAGRAALGRGGGHVVASSPAIARSTASRSTTPTIASAVDGADRPLARGDHRTPRCARSCARRAAARRLPRLRARSRMIQRSVSTWLRGMSRTKFST